MMNTQDFTTMEQLSIMDSVTNGAVLPYGPMVLVTDNAYRDELTAQIYEFVETPEEAGVGIEECPLNFCEKAEQKFHDGGRAMESCLKRAKEYYLSK